MNGTPVTIVGNMTDDPELRFTAGGVAVAKFSVAVNRRTFDRDANAWKDSGSDFHRVTVWRTLAEHVAESLTKGTRVVVVGDLRQSTWTDKDTNQPRSGWDVQAEAVGAELTFATATVVRAKRADGAPDDPWSTGSRQRPAGAPDDNPVASESWVRKSNQRPEPGAGSAAGYSAEPPF